jgi:hypothetical protein
MAISGIIGFIVLATMYPSITGPGIPLHPITVIALCIPFVPFLLICIFSGRSKIWERIGWGVLLLMFTPLFIAILTAIFRAMTRTCP